MALSSSFETTHKHVYASSTKSWKSFRDEGVEKQYLDYSCGSAALATIFKSYYGMNVSEHDILQKVIKHGDDGTASFYDLQKVSEDYSFKASGVRVTFETLRTLQIPAIVYLQNEERDHFSVVKGIGNNGTVSLADPSWGNRNLSAGQFRKMWESEGGTGKVLVVVPQNLDAVTLNKTFFRKPVLNNSYIEMIMPNNSL